MVTIVSNVANGLEMLNDTIIVGQAMKVLRSMYSDRAVPDPSAFVIPRWHSDAAFLGSYSNMKTGATTTSKFFTEMQQVDGVHYFAGEHTDYNYNGFLQGAFRSGAAIAKKIIAGRAAADRAGLL